MKCCAFCGGRLGLMSYRKRQLRFCKKAHRNGYEMRRWQLREAENTRKGWFAFLVTGTAAA